MAFDRLQAIRAFCRIVEVGSFSAAADSLGMPKTTVSGHVQNLEAQLGIKLLHRTTRKVSSTSDGAAYYERALTILNDLDELDASVVQNRNLVHGRVNLEMPSPVCTLLIIPAMPEFMAKYPDIQLDIGCNERVVDLMHEGVDCALRGGGVEDKDLICRPIGQMRFCLFASPGYLFSAAPITQISDLVLHRYLGFKFPTSGRQYIPTLRRGNDSYKIEQSSAIYLNNGSACLAAGLAGLGIAFAPRAEAAPFFKTGELVEVLPDWEMESLPISLVYPYTRHLSTRVRVFADWATQLMASNALWSFEETDGRVQHPVAAQPK
ncbi:LysR family transcriptional regulator [Pseudomonas petrae]|uniref:LysR family transcriptional regulator n=1 Tax=Pseudomonas petrae TaxID=2912190 RepID=A0ABS9I6T7_9PSED|nr:LysR family transcriptional regulator [Pseudomonas petrae]MCF7542793.1 LysR family transcriptional regulator [Pseudomonas petrae]